MVSSTASSSSSSTSKENTDDYNPLPQNAPGSAAAVGHTLANSIPLSIFPIAPDKFCIAFCGLPGRGKTHIARRLGRYLEFFHALPVNVCHVADLRRQRFGPIHYAEWFDPNNEATATQREACFNDAVNQMKDFLQVNDGGVVIIDAANETHEKRLRLANEVRAAGAKLLWVEVATDDETFLGVQYRQTAHSSPDYEGMDASTAEEDYRLRVSYVGNAFESIHTPLPPINQNDLSEEAKNKRNKLEKAYRIESHWSYIKCDHSRKHFVSHNVKGHLFMRAVNFLMNLRTASHAFYLSRHGQSEYNSKGRIGGDSGLTSDGLGYARELAVFVDKNIVKREDGSPTPARLWTSTMRRTKETAQFIRQDHISIPAVGDDGSPVVYEWVQMRPRAWHHLDELFAGSCDGMTYKEIETKFPEEWARRASDKLAYRYPRGESYLDVLARLEPIIIEMERHEEPLLIIAHQGILRIIYAFYMNKRRSEAPYVSIPLNTVVQLTPGAYDCTEVRHLLYSPRKDFPSDGQNEPCVSLDDPPSH